MYVIKNIVHGRKNQIDTNNVGTKVSLNVYCLCVVFDMWSLNLTIPQAHHRYKMFQPFVIYHVYDSCLN